MQKVFQCDKEKYSTCSMNKVWAFRQTPYLLNMCCIFSLQLQEPVRIIFKLFWCMQSFAAICLTSKNFRFWGDACRS